MGTCEKRNVPFSELVVVCGWSSVDPVRVTLTPGRTASELSVTRPMISPDVDWANAVPAPIARHTRSRPKSHTKSHPSPPYSKNNKTSTRTPPRTLLGTRSSRVSNTPPVVDGLG